jgi:hypothetical protein
VADENFNNNITRALLRRRPGLEIVRAQDVGLGGVTDPELLEWAASENRIILTHDVSTMTSHAYIRVVAAQPMPGVWEVSRRISVSTAVDDILLLSDCSLSGEWEGQVGYLPLR